MKNLTNGMLIKYITYIINVYKFISRVYIRANLRITITLLENYRKHWNLEMYVHLMEYIDKNFKTIIKLYE